jgi:hypothetical protein
LFEPGNKLAKGGKRKNAGRPPKEPSAIKKAARVIAREFIEEHVKPVLNNYLKLAEGYYETRFSENGTEYEIFVADGPTTRHFIDKLLPDDKSTNQPSALTINFVRFDNTLQVSPANLPVALLAGDANGKESSGVSLASPSGQGQNGIKFHDF